MPLPVSKIPDRRRSRDFWSRILHLLMGAAWVVFIFAIFIFHRARPEFHTLFDDFYGLDLRRVWDNRFLQYLLYCIIVGLAISLSSLLLGIFRARRKADRKKQLMILATLYTILAILAWRLI